MANNGQGPGQGPKFSWKFAAIGAAAALVLSQMFNNSANQMDDVRASGVPYSELHQKAKEGTVKDALIRRDGTVVGTMSDGSRFRSNVPVGENAYERLRDYGTVVAGEDPPERPSMIGSFLLSMAPMLLLIGVWIWFMKRQAGGGGGGVMGYGKSKAKAEVSDVRFKDVAGIDEALDDCIELVDFLKDPRKFSKLGGRVPKGILMVGPPGTGKTLTARAIAGEAGVPFFTVSGSEFVEMFVGVGAARVRDMFAQAKKQSPSIIFIDEIDAVGKARGQGMQGGNDEREQTLNQLLVEMDGFSADTGVIVIAATNRVDVLDGALTRPGRFDRQIHVTLPDLVGREKILHVHAREIPLGPDVDLRTIAIGTPQFSGADLANLVNEAALRAARLDSAFVKMEHFEYAKDKVMMGPERRGYTMSEEVRRMTAYHEAGHAFVALNEETSDPIYKASIIPRGGALGYVVRMPEGDRVSLSEDRLHGDLAVAMGGRVAEEVFFKDGKRTTGASGDFKMATTYAEKMVTEWGMSSLGPRHYTDRHQSFSGQFSNISEDRKKQIDGEIDIILDRAYKRAKTLISENQDKMELLAEALLKYETLTGKEIRAVVEGQDLEAYRAAAMPGPQPSNDNDAPVLETKRDIGGPKP